VKTYDLEARKRLADTVFASLGGYSSTEIRMLAYGLSLAAEPFACLGQAFAYYADSLDEPVDGWLARLALAHALTETARHPDMADRLEGIDEPPWPAIREACDRLQAAIEVE
jgi:hypothetical protein